MSGFKLEGRGRADDCTRLAPAGRTPFRRRQIRGAVSATQLIVLVIAILAIAGALWWFMGQSGVATLTPAAGPANAPAAGAAQTAAPVVEDLSVNDLYKAARSAMSDNRMVAPPGNNALEFYLRILAKQPDDSGATDALRELFPFATGSAEDQINQGNFDEATRIMALLAKADPSNYTLTILRSKFDAKKKQNDRDQQLQAQQAAAAAAHAAGTPAAAAGTAAVTAPESTAAPTSTAAPPATVAPAPAAPPAEIAKATAPPVVAPATPAVAEPSGESRDVRVVTPPQPTYPAAAVRSRQNGWVEVEFTVAADGSVQDAKVVAANPTRLFDREAVSAVESAKFEPRLDKGKAVATKMRRRIEFKLNN
jgi:protein TonB